MTKADAHLPQPARCGRRGIYSRLPREAALPAGRYQHQRAGLPLAAGRCVRASAGAPGGPALGLAGTCAVPRHSGPRESRGSRGLDLGVAAALGLAPPREPWQAPPNPLLTSY